MGSSLLLKGGTSTPKNIVESFSQANNFSVGDAIRYDIPSSTWVKAQADSAENSEVAGVVSAQSFNTFDLTYAGLILVSALSGVSAPVLFLDSTTAGGLTSSPPSAIGSVIKPVLTKTTNGSGYIVTNYLGTQIGGSSTVAIDEIQPVGTVVPFAGSTIPDSWLECNGASYAVGAYPYLYAKLQNSSGDRAPAYGHVAVLTVGAGPFNVIPSIGSHVIQTSPNYIRGLVIATTATTCTVQTVPLYSTATKNFINNNFVFGTGLLGVEGTTPSTVEVLQINTFLNVSSVATTHFNTPDLRGRFAIGSNTSRLPTNNDLESDDTNNSAISGTYSLGSQGGQEFVAATGFRATFNSSSSVNVAANFTDDIIANIPPYTAVRYIIKASPYTRAAIIDGIDIPYTSLLVGDLRDGSLRPGGSGEDLVFKTNDGSSGVERMRLTNTPTNAAPGSLVVGESSLMSGYNTAYRLLDVAKTTGNGGGVVVTRSASVSLESGVDEGSGSGIIGTRTTHPLIFRTNTTERMRVDANGQANIGSTVNSTSTTTGGLTLGGGLGMASNLTVGGGISAAGGITFSGLTRLTNTTAATSPTVAAFTVAGGIGIATNVIVGDGISAAGGITFSGITRVTNGTPATSTSVAALTVAGGVGIGGALYVGGITAAGGVSMGGALTVGGGITAARLDLGTGVMKSGSITTGSFSANTLSAILGNESNSTASGDLIVAGGAGIGKNLYVGGGITATGSLDLGSGAIKTSGNINCGNILSAGTFEAASLNATSPSASTNTGSGALVVVGGAGIGKNLYVGDGISAAGGITFSGITRVTNSTSATSTSVAALTVAGGVGIAGGLYVAGITAAGGVSMGGALNVGGVVNITNPSTSNSVSSGALVVAGGVGIGGSLFANAITTQTLSAASSTASTNTATGALVVAGGVGIAKNLIVGDGISAAGGITFSGLTRVTNSTSATSTSVAALTVAGGVGIAGGLIVGGNVGIGTTTPEYKLHLVGGTNTPSGIATDGAVKQLFAYPVSGGSTPVAYSGTVSNHAYALITNNAQRLWITNAGNVGIGTNAPTQALDVVGSIVASSAVSTSTLNVSSLGKFSRISAHSDVTTDVNSGYRISARADAYNTGAIIGYANVADNTIFGLLGYANAYSFYGSGTLFNSGALNNTGLLTNTGEITATGNITAFSDIRGKENISTIENGLSKTLTLNGVLFTDKETQQRRTGLIAQDVLAVLPEAVSTNADGYYSLAYGNLVGLLVQAIKELNAKVDSLSAKVETLSSGGSE